MSWSFLLYVDEKGSIYASNIYCSEIAGLQQLTYLNMDDTESIPPFKRLNIEFQKRL